MDTAVNPYVSIPLDQLVVSALNARKINGDSLDELAASIEAEGLLQNLTVTEGREGRFEVIAGKRRLGALQRLREQGRLPAGLEAPLCRVVDDERALSASLAENIVREAMHPADEFLAFKRLAEAGRTSEEIAQEFGVLPIVVERRLRLANVAPSLFEKFQRDEIGLDQMMALAITDDHVAQEAAWNAGNSPWEREAARLRARLTQAEFNIARDRVAVFVGRSELVAAGVIIRGDLFSDAGDGYCSDRLMVDQLALAKLEREAASVRDEGWLWVETRIDFDRWSNEFGRIEPNPAGNLSKADRARLEQLNAEREALEEKPYDENESEEESKAIEDRITELERDIEALEERGAKWSAEQMAAAGAIATIDRAGQLEVHRGLVRATERKQAKSATSTESHGGHEAPKPKAPDDLSATMIARLNAHRTSMVQAAVLKRRDIALAVLAHTLLLGLINADTAVLERPSRIRFTGPEKLEANAAELPSMRYHIEAREVLEGVKKSLPSPTKLLAWLIEQPSDTVLSLLATAGALSVHANLARPQDRAHPVNELIAALGIDFADHWEATPDTFLTYVPRSVIEEAVREARGPADVAKLEGMKKDQVIEAAAQLLAGKRWLPKPLRVPKPKDPPAAAAPVADTAKKAEPSTQRKAKDKVRPAAKNTSAPAKKPTQKPKAKAASKPVAKKPAPAKKAAKRK